MIKLIFWLSALTVFYIYIGYPLLLKLLAYKPRPIARDANFQPSVSILIAAYNEAADIEATLRNKIALDYPRDRLEVLVVSDESTDGTDEIVTRVAQDAPFPIRLFRQDPRQGKTAGLNLIQPQASGDIILFSDANSQWAANAVRQLVSNFADPQIGYVTGKMVYTDENGSLVGDGCSAYMKYENWLREQETAIGSVVGVDGGIDAMRSCLYQPLNADQLPDFVQPLKVVESGYRVIYEPQAILKEEALQDSSSEYAMRLRVTLRALWALSDMRQLLSPASHGLFAIQLISHKLLRYAAFIPLILVAVTATILADAGGWYTLAFIGQIFFYAFAALGHKRRHEQDLPQFLSVPYYFTLLNFACLQAARAYLRGEKKVIWNPRKG